jgi:hypothetical protein
MPGVVDSLLDAAIFQRAQARRSAAAIATLQEP